MYAEATYNVDTEVLPISKLYPSVGVANPEFYREIMEEIKTDGLTFPLVVIRCEVKDWRAIQNASPVLDKPPEDLHDLDIVTWISCGNNRVRVLKELGYTHVDCIVVNTFEEGSDYCRRMRKYHNDKHGRRSRE